MPNNRRQSAVESQPTTSSKPKTPALTAARLESSINTKFHSLGTSTNATNASTPSRNSISRAAVSSEPKNLHRHSSQKAIDNDLPTRPEAPTSNPSKLSSSTQSKKQHRTTTGLGLPSAKSGSIPTKRNLTTSDITPSPSHKKNKLEVEAKAKNDKSGSIPADTLRCHQCRADVPLDNLIVCSNQDIGRSSHRRRRSEPIENPATSATSSTHSAKTPSSGLGPCRISYCGRCLLGR